MSPLLFPCMEQPMRVTLHCNGFYLWGLGNGGVIARQRRSEKDAFRLVYNNNNGQVTLYNHKFGGVLTVVLDESETQYRVLCIQQQDKPGTEKQEGTSSAENVDDVVSATESSETEANVVDDTASSSSEDQQWCFIKGDNNQVVIKCLKTSDNLAVTNTGDIVLVGDSPPSDTKITWDIECVTGELCFLSNPAVECRLRCDLAGLLSVTESWKGWEVFRFMETNHGYVKISSWMHNQWLLCSTKNGEVTTCSHADSFQEDDPEGRCSKWAIERSAEGEGVTIRSKTHGRLLSVRNGELLTYEKPQEGNDKSEEEDSEDAGSVADMKQKEEPPNQWWNDSVRSLGKSMQNLQNSVSNREGSELVLQEDTLVWRIEAAHLQTYYFSNVTVDGEAPKTIGPFPLVSDNLRKTDKVQLCHEAEFTRLYLIDSAQYLSCTAEGVIALVEDKNDKNTEWIMEKASNQAGGNTFRSKPNNLYLSYEQRNDEQAERAPGDDSGKGDPHGEDQSNTSAEAAPTKLSQFTDFFNREPKKISQLVGSSSIGRHEVWKLEPCLPRAVSSDKIKTFALGTSIAVGTTIALPFALAGVGALMGAVGAEVGVLANAIAVGLTGAEALASVGAIGATAYIVFRPEENSLTDDHDTNEEEEERAWSKRPFSNWRNW